VAKLSAWANQNVLFVHAKLDDSPIPYRPMRVLAHLSRALGKRQRGRATGIRGIARVSRMDANTVEQSLKWLEEHGYVKISRKHGKAHSYELQVATGQLYLDHRIDDLGLFPSEFRTLMHMARLADEAGMFFISERKFAKVCGMKRETVHRALQTLEDRGVYGVYAERKNPMCFLSLSELFPRELKTSRNINGNLPDAKKPNGMPETPNSSGPIWPNAYARNA
jgi:DNA-binding MarR family transcriptional regulator